LFLLTLEIYTLEFIPRSSTFFNGFIAKRESLAALRRIHGLIRVAAL
jgi:hypothetical protein